MSLINSRYNVGVGSRTNRSVTTGYDNIAIGRCASYSQPTTCTGNIAIGCGANSTTTYQGNDNIFIGRCTGMNGNYGGSVAVGALTNIQASNYLHVGSSTCVLGTVVTASCTSTKYWKVYINGTLQCVLLK